MAEEIKTQKEVREEQEQPSFVKCLDGKSHYLVKGTFGRDSVIKLRDLVENQRAQRNGDKVTIDLTGITEIGNLASEGLYALLLDTNGEVVYHIPENELGKALYARTVSFYPGEQGLAGKFQKGNPPTPYCEKPDCPGCEQSETAAYTS